MPVVAATPSTTQGPKELSDQNSQGTILGNSPTDRIGFFGGNPLGAPGNAVTPPGVVQPGSQGSLRGNAGVVTVYTSALTPAAVAANTAAEQTFTVTGLAVGQAVAVQKPTTQAGLSIVGARVSATNTLAITFANNTAASITPTAAENYTVEAFPASMVLTAALSPAAVAASSIAEQQFAVAGLPAGAAVFVNKPTAQAGLGIVGARVVSAGILAVTFENFTAASILPTAAENYLIMGAVGIQIAQILTSLQVSLNPVPVAATTTAEQTFTIPGLPLGAQVIVNKPTATPGIGIGNARVSAVNTLAIEFINNTAAIIDPPQETYTLGILPGAAPAAGSSTPYVGQFGGADHSALVSLGLIAGP